MENNIGKIVNDIDNLIEQYYNLKHKETKFELGKSKIHYAGRIFDKEELISLVHSSLEFWLTHGRYGTQFEKKLSEFIGVQHALFVNSGSSANLLAVSALTSPKLGERRLKPGDEVITVAAGFPSTVSPIVQNNLVPVFVDIDLQTHNIDVDELEKAISTKTKAIIIAHTLGNPFNLESVLQFAEKYNLWLIEDNCDALGSLYLGKKTGSFGHLSTCSFYPAHHITTGEGGAVLTNDPILAAIVESMRDWGRDCYCPPGRSNTCGKRFNHEYKNLPNGYDHKYVYSHLGYNLKATDMQAAIGLAQMAKLDSFIETRRRNFNLFYQGLKKHEKYIYLPQATENSLPSWFGFLITIKDQKINKNTLVKYLEENKVETRNLFAGNLIKQPFFDGVEYRKVGELKNTDYIMNYSFFIGVYPGITVEMIDYIVSKFDDFFNHLLL